jgi:hypothetical protein
VSQIGVQRLLRLFLPLACKNKVKRANLGVMLRPTPLNHRRFYPRNEVHKLRIVLQRLDKALVTRHEARQPTV